MFSIIGADGKEYGPVTAEKIREWIAAGRANAQTQVRRDGEAAWSTLGSLPEFSPAATPPPATALAAAAASAPLASREARLGGAILDSLVALACFAPGLVLVGVAGGFTEGDEVENPALFLAGGLWLLAAFAALAAVQCYLLTKHGQSIGKRLMKTRIVDVDDGRNPGFVRTVLLRTILNAVLGAIPFAGSVYSLVDVLFIFREDRRCVHDLIAGTKVVRA
jgi:uncharacterized RDD family membrane protein YckC